LARALFFGLPVHGHVNPTLPLVRELVRRGDEVIYVATPEFATRIGETGASYRPYQNAFLPELGAVSRRMDELAWIFMRTTGEILDQELDAYKALRPDYVVPDSIAPWGHWVAQLLSVPVVTSVTTFAFNRQILRYAVKHGVRPRGGSAFIISKLRHVAKALSLQRRLRRRYGVPGAASWAPSAAAQAGRWSTRRGSFSRAPGRSATPMPSFITHGGMNSLSESLYYGVPMVVIPQMSEQEVVAGRTQELGAGIVLSKPDVTADTLRSSVDRLLADGDFRQRARAIGDSFRAAGGWNEQRTW